MLCFIIGASAPSPNLLFVLTQKVSKKVKTAPASLKKLALEKLKSSKLLPTVVKQEYFCTFLTCFLVHRTRSVGCKLCAIQYFFKCTTS